MADISATIATLENRAMRAWMRCDATDFRKVVQRDCMMMIGTSRPQLLDRPSFVKAMERDFACTRYRLHEGFVRQHGRSAWYVSGVDLEIKLGRDEWNGSFLLSDMWVKTQIKRKWMLAERSLAPLDAREEFSAKIHKLQLWT